MVAAGLLAAALGLLLQPVAIAVLRRRNVLDHPNDRSSHVAATPRGGGIVVLLGLLVSTGVGTVVPNALVLATVGLAALVGLVEDLRGVPPLPRFGLQLLALLPAALVLAGPLGVIAVAAALMFTAAVVNAFNFMDGINGISAGTGAAAGVAYAALLAQQGEQALAVLAAALFGACIAFAPFNAPRARVFLGDVGSYGLGAALAVLSLGLLTAGATPEAALAPLSIYAVDTGATLLRRVRAREPWHLPHRTHVYQRLADCGWSHVQVSLLVTLLTAVAALLGAATLLGLVARAAADLALLVLLAGYLLLPRLFQQQAVAS